MEALSEDEEPQTPIEEFLKPLGLVQHRQTMRQLGFDNPATDFKAQTPDDAQDMKTALLDEKVPLNHVAKIMRSASALRPSTSSASPLDPRLEPVLWSNPIPADVALAHRLTIHHVLPHHLIVIQARNVGGGAEGTLDRGARVN